MGRLRCYVRSGTSAACSLAPLLLLQVFLMCAQQQHPDGSSLQYKVFAQAGSQAQPFRVALLWFVLH